MHVSVSKHHLRDENSCFNMVSFIYLWFNEERSKMRFNDKKKKKESKKQSYKGKQDKLKLYLH